VTQLRRWLEARAGDVASALLGLMFLSFIVQILFRYVLNYPLGWTLEACLTCWLWAVFWGGAFVVDEQDHVKFDVLYLAMPAPARRVMAFISAAAIALAFAVSLPATVSFVTFYKIKSSATLGIRLDLVFSVYLLFALSMIVQYGSRCWRILAGGAMDAADRARLDPVGHPD
jgi:TRAP-type C4-dicarboxylate transport system permease small subunit